MLASTIDTLVTNAEKYSPGTNGGTGGDNAVFGSTTNSGANITRYSYPCHAPLRGSAANDTQAVWSVMCKPQKHEKAVRAFFDWITSHEVSPWRNLLKAQPEVKYKDWLVNSKEFQWTYGFVFDNLTEMPSNLLMNFLVVTRMPKEWPKAIDRWHKLVTEEGIHPGVAFVFLRSFYRSSNGGGGQAGGISESNSMDGNLFGPKDVTQCLVLSNASFYDWPLDIPNAGPDYVSNFVLGIPANPLPSFAKDKPGYTKVNNIWGENEKKAFSPETYMFFLHNLYGGKYGIHTEAKSTLAGKPIVVESRNWRVNYKELVSIMKEEEARFETVYAGIDAAA